MQSKEEFGKNLINKISESIEQIKHGNIELVIQDSRVIQINKTEKMRLDRNCKVRSR